VAFFNKTCGYLKPTGSPLTCPGNSGCYTWREASVQGCCDTRLPASACDIATTCVPSSAARALTGSEPPHVIWCTVSTAPFCAQYRYSYDGSMVSTQHFCDSSTYTSTVYPTPISSQNGTSVPTTESTLASSNFGTGPTGNPGGGAGQPSGSIPTGKLVA
jgi:hypothetical protein